MVAGPTSSLIWEVGMQGCGRPDLWEFPLISTSTTIDGRPTSESLGRMAATLALVDGCLLAQGYVQLRGLCGSLEAIWL